MVKTQLLVFIAFLTALVLLAGSKVSAQAGNVITVKANQVKASIKPTMYGIFFEDINFGADGGLYAELIKNRSFEFYNPLMGWTEVAQNGGKGKIFFVNVGGKSPKNTRHAHITVDAANGAFGFANEGYRGIGVKQNGKYDFSLFARKGKEGSVTCKLELISSKGVKLGEATLGGFTDKWSKHATSLTSSGTDEKAHLNVLFTGKGIIDVDMLSLFPEDTWKNRKNGLRSDLVQKLADLKPG